MKKTISLIIAFALLCGMMPAVAFAGSSAFPQIDGTVSIGSGYRGTITPTTAKHIQFTAEADGNYFFETHGPAEVAVSVYNTDGEPLSYDEHSGTDMSILIAIDLSDGDSVVLEITSLSLTDNPFYLSVRHNTITGIEIARKPYKTEYIANFDSHIDTSGLLIKVNYSDQPSIIWDTSTGNGPEGSYFTLESPVIISLGANTAKVGYFGHTASFSVNGINNPYSSIQVAKLPDQTEFIAGYDYNYINWGGLVLKLNRTDGTAEYAKYYDTDLPEYDSYLPNVGSPSVFTLGTNTVNVNLFNLTTSFNVTAIANPISGISLITPPDETSAIVGTYAYPNLYGMSVRIDYTDGTHDTYNADGYSMSFKGIRFNAEYQNTYYELGENILTINYAGFECTAVVNAINSPVESISVLTLPDKTQYFVGESDYDLTGLKLSINYTNGDSLIWNYGDNDYIDDYYISFYADLIWFSLGDNDIIIEYMGVEERFTVTAVESPITRIDVVEPATKTDYYSYSVSSSLQLDGLVLRIRDYNGVYTIWDYTENNGLYNGIPVTYNEFYEFDPYMYLVRISLAGMSATMPVTIKPFNATKITITRLPDLETGLGAVIEVELEDLPKLTIDDINIYQYSPADREFYNGTVETEYGTFMWHAFLGIPENESDYALDISMFGVCTIQSYSSATLGDMDDDSEITVSDALAALRIAARLVTPTADDISRGDVDGDGSVTVSDALAILRVAARLVDSL